MCWSSWLPLAVLNDYQIKHRISTTQQWALCNFLNNVTMACRVSPLSLSWEACFKAELQRIQHRIGQTHLHLWTYSATIVFALTAATLTALQDALHELAPRYPYIQPRVPQPWFPRIRMTWTHESSSNTFSNLDPFVAAPTGLDWTGLDVCKDPFQKCIFDQILFKHFQRDCLWSITYIHPIDDYLHVFSAPFIPFFLGILNQFTRVPLTVVCWIFATWLVHHLKLKTFHFTDCLATLAGNSFFLLYRLTNSSWSTNTSNWVP